MKISTCCTAIRKSIRYGRRFISVGILLSLWVTMLLLFDVLSENSLWTGQMGYDNQISDKWSKLKLQHLHFPKKNRSSSFVKKLAGEIEAEKKDIGIQGLYRGSVRKIESIGLEQTNTGNLNPQAATNGKTIHGHRKERNLTRIHNRKNSPFPPERTVEKNTNRTRSERTVEKNTNRTRSKCDRVKSRNEFSRCVRKIGYQTRQKRSDEHENDHEKHTTLPHENNITSFSHFSSPVNSDESNPVSPTSDSSQSSQIDGTNLDETVNFYSNDIDKETFLKLRQDGFLDYSYNVTASNKLDLNRVLPDARPHSCKFQVVDVSILPKASVIISFHNEATSVLLRTISSVITRSPPSVLQEIILVDDNSSKGCYSTSTSANLSFINCSLGYFPFQPVVHNWFIKGCVTVACPPLKHLVVESILLSGPSCNLGYFPFQPVVHNWLFKGRGAVDNSFESAIKLWPKVKLLRTARREGLVRARLLGASEACGSVLVFLDSHCECTERWLEPLLYAVSHDRTKIVSPYIDAVKADSFDYVPAPDNLYGAFTWRMEFVWKGVPPHIVQHRASSADPIKSPVISGGLFVVDKEFFFSLGSYDEHMEIWGGENLELSFRAWMCGGSMEILPCSRVGHVFRNLLPYKFPGDGQTTLLRNLGRVAEVWMDEYKEHFFSAVDFPESIKLGNLTARHRLRKDLHCRSFQWYLNTVIPELAVPPRNAVVFGEFRNLASLTCLTSRVKSVGHTELELSACLGDSPEQLFYINSDGYFHHDSSCLVSSPNKGLSLGPCKHQQWLLMEKHIQMNGTELCVTGVDNEFVALRQCSREDISQMWDITYQFKRNTRSL